MFDNVRQENRSAQFNPIPISDRLSNLAVSLLQQIGEGEMNITAYDTSWAARLGNIEPKMATEAVNWLRENQLSDGSWGSPDVIYHHDRTICTLAAVAALALRKDVDDQTRITNGLEAIRHHSQKLEDDIAGESIAFEYLVPTFLREFAQLGIDITAFAEFLSSYETARQTKLEKVPSQMIDRGVTMAFSAEMAGHDSHHILNLENLSESNGSIGLSPSATAYYLLEHAPDDLAAREYLRANFKNGGLTVIAPFDVFERTWVLWNLAITGSLTNEMCQAANRHVRFLKQTWRPGKGMAMSSPYSQCDGDDTAFVFETLCRYGESPDIEALLRYEDEDYFRCFEHEANPSVSTNIHMLGALLHAGFADQHPAVKKVLSYLSSIQSDGYWFGKWHASPFYPTAHLVIAAAERFPDMVTSTNHWLHTTQHPAGGWGYYGPTAEETAYALQALFTLRRNGFIVSKDVLLNGARWLAKQNHHHPSLWIGKCLYAPVRVIESTVLSALSLANQHFPEIGIGTAFGVSNTFTAS